MALLAGPYTHPNNSGKGFQCYKLQCSADLQLKAQDPQNHPYSISPVLSFKNIMDSMLLLSILEPSIERPASGDLPPEIAALGESTAKGAMHKIHMVENASAVQWNGAGTRDTLL